MSDGVRWDVMASDIRNVSRRFLGMLRTDWTVWMLLFANIVPVVDLAVKGEPVGSILIIFWLQLMIIGFWNIARLVMVSRWLALLVVPVKIVLDLFGHCAEHGLVELGQPPMIRSS